MYEQVFNLTSRPFTSMHYVKHYFPAKAISESLQTCKMMIERGAGPVVVVGDHGTGKTLLIAMLEEMFKAQLRIVSVSATVIRGREDLLQNILYQLQLNHRGLGENEMRLDLTDYLRKDESKGILLLVDNAQKLTPGAIEEIQLLLDFIQNGQPHIRMVFAGSQGLEDRLADNRLVPFNQRIAGRCMLACLGCDEVEAYVRAHLERAGGDPDVLFSPESWRAIYEVTEGRPRFINQVCDHAMIFSATRGIVPVTDSLVREAWYDIQRLPGSVVPTGSGAQIDETPVVTQGIESQGEDGWTVLEFGQLGDGSEEAADDTPVVSEQAVAVETSQEHSSGLPAQETLLRESVSVEPAATAEQFSAVEPPSPPPEPFVESSATVFPEEPVVEAETPSLDVPTAAGGAAILASAMAGFGMTQETESPSEEQFTQPEAVVPQVPVPEVFSPQPVEAFEEPAPPQPIAEFTPEPPQPAVEPAPETLSPVAQDPFGAYDFENEEVLSDAYSPFVAQQNQRSLEVTSEQLQSLTPADEAALQTPSFETGEIVEEAVFEAPQEEEVFPTFETAMKSVDPVRAPVMPTLEPREMHETREEAGVLGPNSLSEEFDVNRAAVFTSADQLSSSQSAQMSVDVEPLESQAGSGYVPLDPDAAPLTQEPALETPQLVDAQSLQTPQELPPKEFAPPSQDAFAQPVEQIVAPNVSVPSLPPVESYTTPDFGVVAPEASGMTIEVNAGESATQYHEQATPPEDPDIRRQAEEIIRSLGFTEQVDHDVVSHETSQPEPTIEEETNAIEATIQRSIAASMAAASEPEPPAAPPVVMPDANAIQQALQLAQQRQGYAHVPPTQPVPSQLVKPPQVSVQVNPQPAQPLAFEVPATSIPVQIAADPIESERRILEEVQEQVAMIAPTPIEPGTPVQDDRDILAIKPNEHVSMPAEAKAEMPAWSQQEPSTGDANRVDYQRLFDQLRNVQDQ